MSRTAKGVPAQTAPKAQQSTQLPWKDRITQEDYEELKATFEVFDQDGSGTIDPAQITNALEQLGVEKRNNFVLELIYALRDKNKSLNFNEFLDIICSRVGQTKTKDGMKKVFAIYDKDENGIIDFHEFKAIAKQIHENLDDDALLEMMHSASINHRTSSNEGFTFDEFYGIVSKFVNK